MAALYPKGVAPPHVTLNQIFAGMISFMAIQVPALFLLHLFPQMGLWLSGIVCKWLEAPGTRTQNHRLKRPMLYH